MISGVSISSVKFYCFGHFPGSIVFRTNGSIEFALKFGDMKLRPRIVISGKSLLALNVLKDEDSAAKDANAVIVPDDVRLSFRALRSIGPDDIISKGDMLAGSGGVGIYLGSRGMFVDPSTGLVQTMHRDTSHSLYKWSISWMLDGKVICSLTQEQINA